MFLGRLLESSVMPEIDPYQDTYQRRSNTIDQKAMPVGGGGQWLEGSLQRSQS